MKENGLLPHTVASEVASEIVIPDNRLDTESNRNITGIDRSLIFELVNDSHEAFDAVFHAFYARVKSFLRVITHSDDLADEVSQKVFINLWTYRKNINPDRNINAYIYTMARNAAFTALKNQFRDTVNIYDSVEYGGSGLTDDQLIARETDLLIKMTVSRMPPKRKQVYEMSRYEYKSNEEISKELKISKKVVERHLRLALTEIREVVRVTVAIFFN